MVKHSIKRIGAVVISVIIILAVLFAHPWIGHNLSNRGKNTTGIPIGFSVSPDITSSQLLAVYIQVWSANPPMQRFSTAKNIPQLLGIWANSTGVVSGYLPFYFLDIASNWSGFFRSAGQLGAETSFTAQLTYYFYYNKTTDQVILYSDQLPYNPLQVNRSSVFSINLHPSLIGRPHIFVNSTATTGVSSASASALSNDPSQGQTRWVLMKRTTFGTVTSPVEIPIAWANDTGGNTQIITSVTIGAINNEVGWTTGQGYNESSKYSFYLSTGSSYTSPSNVSVSTETFAVTSPNASQRESAGFIYANGSLEADIYQEQEYECFASVGGEVCMWVNLSIYETIPLIDIVNTQSSNGNTLFQLGYVYDGYDAYSPYTSPQAISTLNWPANLIKKFYTNLSAGSEVQWSTVYSSITGSDNNLGADIFGILSIGLSFLGVITAAAVATGWIPGDGWAAIAADDANTLGMYASVASLLSNGIMNAKSSTVIFSGDILNNGYPTPTQGNTIALVIYSLNLETSISGTDYILPVFDGVGAPNP
ncbi:MAG: hypothetical protein KIS30_08905 [Thermoplasmata archaeon]|nr:hypothetical protein [Candidatus Sysuiplasma acidicola]MBX8646858.1 hypothetical protein [Candidatus Sysuiplasma acidicola]